MTDEEIVEMVYAEALALSNDLEDCTTAEHELLRWVAGKMKERISYQLAGETAG